MNIEVGDILLSKTKPTHRLLVLSFDKDLNKQGRIIVKDIDQEWQKNTIWDSTAKSHYIIVKGNKLGKVLFRS